MLVDALRPALEDAEIALNRVRVLLVIVKAHVLAAAVVDRAVTRELDANVRVEAALVHHQLALATAFWRRISLMVSALAWSTWKVRALPPRSTSATTGRLPAGPL